MNEGFEDQNLIELPEQKTGYPELSFIWFISREFKQLIDRMPYYSGVLLEGEKGKGEVVRLGFAQDLNFLPDVPLKAYFKGDAYAKLFEKSRPLYVPEGFEGSVKATFRESLEGILGDLQIYDSQVCPMTSGEILGYLKRKDERR